MTTDPSKTDVNTPTTVHDLAGQTKPSTFSFNTPVKGIDLDGDVSLDDIIESYKTMGIQASNLYQGIQEIRRMRAASAKIFFGCTSNMISCGARELINFLVKNSHIDVFVTTAGGIEEDIIKCLKPTFMADFHINGKELREQGWNRIGNMVVNNANYVEFETFMTSFFDAIVFGKEDESYNRINNLQSLADDFSSLTRATVNGKETTIITPSEMIRLLGKRINNPESVLYWCYKNDIPVYSTAITDGSLGDMMSFYHSRDQLIVDICRDIKALNFESLSGKENGAIIIGGGLIKHMIFNANLFNNGLDYCVLINTAIEHDGSDAGAPLSESYSWGKVKPDRNCIKIYSEATLILPLVLYGGFKSKRDFSA